MSSNDFNAILKYPFSGQQWFVRICLQGAVLMLLCPFLIGIPFLNGFVLSITKKGIDGATDYPTWSDWGTYWRIGWKALAVNFVYMIPIFAVFLTYFAIVLIPIIIGQSTGAEEVAAIGGIFGAIGMVGLYLMMFVYMIFFALVQMATAPLLAQDLPMSSAFQFKHYIFPYIKANIVNMILAWLLSYLAGLVANVGMLFFFIGLFLTMPLAFALVAYANGLIYRLSTIKYNVQH